MRPEALEQRMELLDIGEQMGWPRLTYGRPTKVPHDKRIPAGKDAWEQFCGAAHVRRLMPALRVAHILNQNGVEPFHPLSAAEMRAQGMATNEEKPSAGGLGDPEADSGEKAQASAVPSTVEPPSPVPVTDLLEDITPLAIPTRRQKKGGHKRPPHPNSKRRRI